MTKEVTHARRGHLPSSCVRLSCLEESMSPVPSTRRLAIAIATAAASATVAAGITAASLLGWFGSAPSQPAAKPASEAPAAASPVILVPVTLPPSPPATEPGSEIQLVMSEGARRQTDMHDYDREDREHGRANDNEEHDDDD
jgi:hypothetical protein